MLKMLKIDFPSISSSTTPLILPLSLFLHMCVDDENKGELGDVFLLPLWIREKLFGHRYLHITEIFILFYFLGYRLLVFVTDFFFFLFCANIKNVVVQCMACRFDSICRFLSKIAEPKILLSLAISFLNFCYMK